MRIRGRCGDGNGTSYMKCVMYLRAIDLLEIGTLPSPVLMQTFQVELGKAPNEPPCANIVEIFQMYQKKGNETKCR